MGEIQPIGGVNEKIEGFFESCQKRGLSGKQGVLIPAKNIRHLALNRKVVEAAESKNFSIFGVNNIEEALEILTGIPAGEMTPDGQYPPDSIFGRVAKRFTEMAMIAEERGERRSPKSSKDSKH